MTSPRPPATPRASATPGPRMPPAAPRRFPLARRNLVILAAAVTTLAVGYLTLSAGHASAAAVILVIGYCVLFPLGIAL